jgi:hypothetical protein
MQIRNITRSIRLHEIRDNIRPFLNAKENVLDIGCDTGFITERRFDTALLIDTLHHVPYNEQIILIREAKRVADRVIIWESEPSWVVDSTDWLQRKNMLWPGTYRFADKWNGFLIPHGFYRAPISRSWWYPIKHCMFISK